MSDKDYYKVVGTMMLKASSPKKPFQEKYDLTNYTVRLSKADKDKFYLEPIDLSLGLDVVKFVCEDADVRANWYKSLLKVTKSSDANSRKKSLLYTAESSFVNSVPSKPNF